MEAAGIELGGVEYMVDDRDGRRVYYDINALSNFVADGQRVVGFDPFVRLADWLEREAAEVNRLRADASVAQNERRWRGSADAVRILVAGVRRVAAQRR